MIDRRTMMTAALAAVAGASASKHALAQAGMSRVTAYAFSFPGLAGDPIRLAEFTGRPLLIVNTASLCGFTPQYGGLQELWTEFGGRGLMIVGVTDHVPSAATVAVNTSPVGVVTVILSPGGAPLPEIVGVESLVKLSPATPESEAGLSTAIGASGGVVSTGGLLGPLPPPPPPPPPAAAPSSNSAPAAMPPIAPGDKPSFGAGPA